MAIAHASPVMTLARTLEALGGVMKRRKDMLGRLSDEARFLRQ
ncbi:hypothetical protein [Thauera sp.]|nr:hypothetical protein [Thauera sp.]